MVCSKCAFGYQLKSQLILLFSLFMGLTALFGTIYGSYCTILTNFYLYLQYFQQKVFSFSKINGSQTDSSVCLGIDLKLKLFYYSAYFYYYLWVSLYFLESHCTISTNFYFYLQ